MRGIGFEVDEDFFLEPFDAFFAVFDTLEGDVERDFFVVAIDGHHIRLAVLDQIQRCKQLPLKGLCPITPWCSSENPLRYTSRRDG